MPSIFILLTDSVDIPRKAMHEVAMEKKKNPQSNLQTHISIFLWPKEEYSLGCIALWQQSAKP